MSYIENGSDSRQPGNIYIGGGGGREGKGGGGGEGEGRGRDKNRIDPQQKACNVSY